MKVLHVINSLPAGGAERLLVDLLPHFKAAGLEIRVVVLESRGDHYSQAVKDAGAELAFLSPRGLKSPGRILDLAREIRAFKPEVVHAHLYPSILWTAAARGRKARARFVLTEHNTLNRRMDYFFLQPVERWLYQRYDAVAAISPAVATTLGARLGRACPDRRVIPNGFDPGRFFPKPGPKVAGQFRIAMAARFNAQKDHATVLRALALLPEVFHCSFAGEGETLPAAKALCHELGLDGRVEFLGLVADLPALYGTMDAYVQASNWEGFGLAALEAMACGLPVAASQVPGLGELVEGAGLLFPPHDPEALARALSRLHEDLALRQDLAARGQERAKLYTIAASSRAYIDLYTSLAKGSSS